jgi:hypothetical protein
MRPLQREQDIIHQDELYVELGLTRGKHTLIDLEDYERLKQFNWAYHETEYQKRAVRYSGRITYYLHHDVLKVNTLQLKQEGLEVDHWNRNTLDNRKGNLRIVTHTANMQNTERHDNHVGVAFHSQSGLYMAYVNFPKKMVSLGYWRTREKAAEIAAMGRELKKIHTDKETFLIEWRKIKPRRKYAREGM